MSDIHLSTPKQELDQRVNRFQKVLVKKNINAALLVYKTDLFYFAGTLQQGWLYIPAEGKPVFMVFKDLDRARKESALDHIVDAKGPKDISGILDKFGHELPSFPDMLGLEFDVLPVNQFTILQNAIPNADFIDVSTDIRLLRAVKSDYEIQKMRVCAEKWDQVMKKVPEFIYEGVSEVEAAGHIEGFARSLGHQGFIRMRMWTGELLYGHFMSGPNAAEPSHLASPTGGPGTCAASAQGAGFKKIARNEPVLIDYGFGYDGYITDNTRIFSIGPLADELVKAHEAMLENQEIARKMGVPGTPSGEIYLAMLAHAEKNGFKDYFMGAGERRIKFTGHGIGLELDEFPFIAKGQKLPLQKNMVIAIEPKIVIPGKGVVGIENTHVVTEQGLEPLPQFPDTIQVL